MKLIDAEKLKAQIQFLIDSGYDNLQGNLYHVLSIIDSLQQEQSETDLEKEIDRVFFQKDCGSDILYHKEIANIARHFYELGLNTRKEE